MNLKYYDLLNKDCKVVDLDNDDDGGDKKKLSCRNNTDDEITNFNTQKILISPPKHEKKLDWKESRILSEHCLLQNLPNNRRELKPMLLTQLPQYQKHPLLLSTILGGYAAWP